MNEIFCHHLAYDDAFEFGGVVADEVLAFLRKQSIPSVLLTNGTLLHQTEGVLPFLDRLVISNSSVQLQGKSQNAQRLIELVDENVLVELTLIIRARQSSRKSVATISS